MIHDFKKKQHSNASRKFLFAFFGILILSLAFLLIIVDIKIYKKRQQLAYQVESLQNKIQDIKKKNNDLTQATLKENDSQYIEKVAREELDLQKPGEKVVSFINQQAQSQQSSESKKSILQMWLSNVSGVWNWIKNKF